MLNFLRGPIVSLMSAGLATLLLVFCISLWFQKEGLETDLEHTKAELVISQRDLAQCQTNRVSLQGALNEQKARIEALGREANQRETRLRTQAETAERNARVVVERAQRILSASGSTCEDADRLILENTR